MVVNAIKVNFLAVICLCVISKPPNVVLFLVDDQDIQLNGMQALPKAYKIFGTNGIEFVHAFASTPVCCVSRASILTGRYVHNHEISNNSIFGGCGSKKWIQRDEPFTYASYIINSNNNYRTFYSGKYLNLYGKTDQMPYTHVPKGWTDWYGLIGDAKYYDYRLSINGESREYHGYNGDDDYLPYVMKNKAIDFLDNIDVETTPFLMELAFPSGHSPWTPPDKYLNVFDDEQLLAPFTPNFNYFNEDGTNNDKGPVLRQQHKMNDKEIKMANKVYRGRHGTFLAVDDIVDEIYNKINDLNELDNTYFIYTSDHGFHIGQYGMWFGKKLLYETDLRIPFFINGPDINPQQITSKTALTIDIGPTIIDIILGDADIPDTMDGESLLKYINMDIVDENNIFDSHQSFLIEYYGETDIHHVTDEPYTDRIIKCPSKTETIGEIPCDLWNNTYKCIRTIDGSKLMAYFDNDNIGQIFCQYTCYDDAYNIVNCVDNSVESRGEYYNLNIDPWQLTNTYDSLSTKDRLYFKELMKTHMNCKGNKCSKLRTKNAKNKQTQSKQSNINVISFKSISKITFGIAIFLSIWAAIYLKYGTLFCCWIQSNGKEGYKYTLLQRKTNYNAAVL